jgi:hypothetical protein
MESYTSVRYAFFGETPEKITQSPHHGRATPGGRISSGRSLGLTNNDNEYED